MHFATELMNGSSISSLSLCTHENSGLSIIMFASLSCAHIFFSASLIELHGAS